MKKLFPKGIQTFADIRKGNYYYVDKTSYIIELLKEKFVFLSRPRRFGKSLTLDTIAELFSGNKTLFKGLYAENHWNWQKTYPIIRIDFGLNTSLNYEYLTKILHEQISEIEREFGIERIYETYSGRFGYLLKRISEQYQSQVVVLIDEYDKPILDSITDEQQAVLVRDVLRDFYGSIKASDNYIRFSMLTGVSRFSKINLFSGLNNLTDITLLEEFSAFCGYTQAELETVFAPELEGIDLAKVKHWYNGYNWTGESVYNPYDILLFLSNSRKMFKAYWFETGSPTFLMDMLLHKHIDITSLQGIDSSEQVLSQFEVGNISPIALMFQTGYLTVDKVLQLPFGVRYTFKFPNIEVQQSFNQAVIYKFLPTQAPQIIRIQSQLYQNLVDDDLAGMFATIQSFFAGIPYNWHSNNDIAHFEGYWASVFYAYFASIGLHINVEEPTSNGRMDMTVLFADCIYIFEFKVIRQSSDKGSALAQIQDKKYAQKYQGLGKKIYEIGVEFDEKSLEVGFEVI